MENYLNSSVLNLNIIGTRGNYYSIVSGMAWELSSLNLPENKFYYILEGSCTITIDGKDYIGKAGSWFFIPAHTEHSYRNDRKYPFKLYWIHFEVFPSDITICDLKLPYLLNVQNEFILKLFAEYTTIHDSLISSELHKKSILLRLLSEFIKISSAGLQHSTTVSKKKLNDILRYFHNNIDKNISVKETASKFYMQPSHFVRYFKNNTGYTPAKYIKDMKLTYAKTYLEQTDMPIAQIMEMVGESNLSSFSKQFKSKYLYSPRQYRDIYNKKKFLL